MKTIYEQDVKDILQNREQKIRSIHEKMNSLYQELEGEDDILESAALPGINLSGMPGKKGGHKDLGDILDRYGELMRERSAAVREIMWRLVDELDAINRVWACLHALDEPYYSILHDLYVENQLYQAVENASGMSHKTFEKYRARGIDLIIGFYNSGNSIAEIMRSGLSKKESLAADRPGEKKSKEYEQIHLYDLI